MRAQAAGEARGVVDRAAGLGISSGASVLPPKLNELLEAERFGEFVESRYAKFHAERKGAVADVIDEKIEAGQVDE
jgi:hypothetical protein